MIAGRCITHPSFYIPFIIHSSTHPITHLSSSRPSPPSSTPHSPQPSSTACRMKITSGPWAGLEVSLQPRHGLTPGHDPRRQQGSTAYVPADHLPPHVPLPPPPPPPANFLGELAGSGTRHLDCADQLCSRRSDEPSSTSPTVDMQCIDLRLLHPLAPLTSAEYPQQDVSPLEDGQVSKHVECKNDEVGPVRGWCLTVAILCPSQASTRLNNGGRQVCLAH
jgi:hypothetical protein